jgi:hypothetical protein
MGWKDFFVKKGKTAATDEIPKNLIGIQGNDVSVNPSASQKLKRLSGRLERLGLSLIKMEKRDQIDTDRYKSFKEEYDYKLLKLQYKISREA